MRQGRRQCLLRHLGIAEQMSIREYMDRLTVEFTNLFADFHSGISAREDSRAFGAMIERRITDNWEDICNRTDSEYVANPGRKTIYDFASRHEGIFFGFDVKTKDLDSERYSDGGVCSVGNLLRFLANDGAIFVIVEFGHHKAKAGISLRVLDYVSIAPFHILPEEIYRIENLGTGQVRFNQPIHEVFEKIAWGRSLDRFFDMFVDKVIAHYEQVGQKARQRSDAMRRFRDAGYRHFRF